MCIKKLDLISGVAEVESPSGRVFSINLYDSNAQHWNYDYVSTVQAAQGKTAERVIYHAESFRKNLSSQKALYVSLSRAKNEVTIYTDDKERLIWQLYERTGEKQNAVEKAQNFDREYQYDFG